MIKFSVIIPVYNASSTILNTLLSCINQSYPVYELIIVNDHSTDDSIAIIKTNFPDNNITIIDLPENKGVSNARNCGWEYATGDFVAFLDSDDIWHVDKLKIIAQFIESYDTQVKCLGNAYTDDQAIFDKPFVNVNPVKLKFQHLLFRNYFNTSCLVVKRDIGLKFNAGMRYTEDHELLLRISKTHEILFIKNYLTLLGRPQLSKGGLSGNKIKMRIGEMKMYKEAAKSNIVIGMLLPFLIGFSFLKHLIKIAR